MCQTDQALEGVGQQTQLCLTSWSNVTGSVGRHLLRLSCSYTLADYDWSSSSISMCDRERIHLKHEQPGEAKGRGGGKPKDMSKKAILLSGPPGIGKTSSASIISRCACCLVAAAGSHLSAYTLAVTLHYSSMPPFRMMSYAYVLHSESPSATCQPHVAEVPSFVLMVYLMGWTAWHPLQPCRQYRRNNAGTTDQICLHRGSQCSHAKQLCSVS